MKTLSGFACLCRKPSRARHRMFMGISREPFCPHLMAVALFSLSFLFTSCTKQVAADAALEKNSIIPITNNGCRPVSLGVFVQQPPENTGVWTTAMQKWYGSDGKVAYLKATLDFADGSTSVPPFLEWGEVTYYNNNQVYVKNVPKNDTIIRITLDGQERPAASYFHYVTPYGVIEDTSYYFHTGTRLDSIINTSPHMDNLATRVFRKYIFSYDGHGNMIRVDIQQSIGPSTGAPSTHTSYLEYDYTQPVTGMLPAYMLDRPFRLVEYLDLGLFPIHHRLVRVLPDPNFVFPVYPSPHVYTNYQLLPNGLVYSYEVSTSFERRTYYTGWECGSN